MQQISQSSLLYNSGEILEEKNFLRLQTVVDIIFINKNQGLLGLPLFYDTRNWLNICSDGYYPFQGYSQNVQKSSYMCQ